MTLRGGTGESGASGHAFPWQVHAASAIGAAHAEDGRPNQDAVAHQLLTLPGGSALLVVAIADGHGDSRHFRSDRGAKMAVAAGIAAVRDWSGGISGSPAEIKQGARRGLVPAIVAGWNAAVTADLAHDQFTAAERIVLAELGLPPQTAYGSTLLIGAFTEGHAVFAQIGDGNIVAVAPDGRAMSPVPGDGGPDRNHTASLCQDDASAAFRIGVIQLAGRPVFAALLATDGFGNAQVQDPWQADVAADLASFGLDHGQDWFAAQVPGWAAQCASSAGSGDDSTIALVINSAVRPGRELSHTETMPAQTLELPVPPVPRPVSGDRSDRAPDERRPGWPRNRAGAWTAAAIAVLLAVVLLGFLLFGHGQRLPGPASGPRPAGSWPRARRRALVAWPEPGSGSLLGMASPESSDPAPPPAWFTTAIGTPAKRATVEVDGTTIAYQTYGERGDGGIVLVHGGAAHARWWDHIAPLLATGRQVVAPDLSGHGDSGRRDAYSLDQWAHEVLAVAADAGFDAPPTVIGHSMGGFVTLRAASIFGARIAGAVAIDSPVRDITPEERAARERRAFGPLVVYPSPEAAIARFHPIPDQPGLPYVIEHVAATSIRAVDGGWSWKFDPRVFARHTLTPALLTRLDCRVALFRAEYGILSPQMSEVMYDRLGRLAPVIEIPAAGHHVMLDYPLALVTGIRTLLSDWDHSTPATPR